MYMGVTGCGDPPKVYVCLFVKISVWKRTFPHRGCFFGSSTVSHIITAIILFYSINRAVHQILFLLFLFFLYLYEHLHLKMNREICIYFYFLVIFIPYTFADLLDFSQEQSDLNLLLQVTESDAVDVVEAALRHHSSDITTRAMSLISLLKLSSRFPPTTE